MLSLSDHRGCLDRHPVIDLESSHLDFGCRSSSLPFVTSRYRSSHPGCRLAVFALSMPQA